MLAITRLDAESARAFAHDYEDAFYRGDHQALASVYAEDAKLIVQGSEPIVGRRAIEEFWKRACERARAVGMKRSIYHDEVESRGDLGYQRSRVVLEIPSADEHPTTVTSRSITIWKQHTDGVWRMTVDISNTDVALESGQSAYGVTLKGESSS